MLGKQLEMLDAEGYHNIVCKYRCGTIPRKSFSDDDPSKRPEFLKKKIDESAQIIEPVGDDLGGFQDMLWIRDQCVSI